MRSPAPGRTAPQGCGVSSNSIPRRGSSGPWPGAQGETGVGGRVPRPPSLPACALGGRRYTKQVGRVTPRSRISTGPWLAKHAVTRFSRYRRGGFARMGHQRQSAAECQGVLAGVSLFFLLAVPGCGLLPRHPGPGPATPSKLVRLPRQENVPGAAHGLWPGSPAGGGPGGACGIPWPLFRSGS